MNDHKIKIGIFDSGMGGLSVANAINKELPEYDIIYRQDNEHMPYGSKSVDEILGYVKPILQEMVNEVAVTIVLACTHYHWIEEEIKSIAAGRAIVLKPESVIVRQLERVINNLNKNNPTETVR